MLKSMTMARTWLVLVVMLATATSLGCGRRKSDRVQPGGADGPTVIIFTSGVDDSGTVRRMVEAFNTAHEGKIKVQWRPMPPENDAHRKQILAELTANKGEVDLVASDVVWTAELAKSGAVLDVTDRFAADIDRKALLPAAVASARYRLRVWGVPWYTDAGMLFYRKDKLAESGFKEPPATWDELIVQAKKVQAAGTRLGFVFQGAAYEGGTVNAAEYIWSAGGELVTSKLTVTGLAGTRAMEVDAVTINSTEAARGLDIARKLIAEGVTPAQVTSYREKEALEAFAAGDAVFLRSWPYAYTVLKQRGMADKIGVAPLPAASESGRRASCLGGWNLMISAHSTPIEQEAAWTFARYLTDPAQQQRQAREAGLLPVITALYDDAELVAQVPVMSVGKELFASQLRSRPKSPYYGEMSSKIAAAFQRSLNGEQSGAAAVKTLDGELRDIANRN